MRLANILSIRRRLGAWLGLLAVFAALSAPVSLLAHDVQNGKLGGLCSAASKVLVEKNVESPADPALLSVHCEACVASAFALPPAALLHTCSAAAALSVSQFQL